MGSSLGEIIKKMEYKWARMTSRKLFKNEFQAEILTEYFRNATRKMYACETGERYTLSRRT